MMIIVVFSFTLIISFVVSKLISRDEYTIREKPMWKKLVYWGTVLFISAVFNVIMYINNTSMYRLSSYANNETMEIIIFIALSYLLIQIISPSISFDGIIKGMKAAAGKLKELKPVKDSRINDTDISLYKRANANTTVVMHTNSSNEFTERDFELFLNTLCWLAFSFALFINAIWAAVASLYRQNQLLKIEDIQSQLNYISCIMLIFTLPISLRQILFYLIKVRKNKEEQRRSREVNSVYYERYMLVQKNLTKIHKKL